MSALFGAVMLGGAPSVPGLAEEMSRRLAHRRAETVSGTWAEGPVLLGGRAPEGARSGLPFRDAESGLVCVADCRLDARAELAAALSLREAPELCDEALLIAAYLRWGQDFVRHLRGDFAFALWSPREQTLLLARDPFGLRSLYYAELEGALLFASQARALFAHPGLSRELDSLRIAQYLARVFDDYERTFYRDVSRLVPGHVLVQPCRSVRTTRRYFALDPTRRLPEASSAAYADQFRALFVDAVRERAPSTERVGCLLSGGLDSSGLYGALLELDPARELPCFSARFPDFAYMDEGAWLDLLPAAPGVRRHELRADRIGPLDRVDALHALLDEPFHAPNLFIYDALAELSARCGVRVLLDGLDGDTVIDHGYAYLGELLFALKPRRLARALRALKRRTELPYRELLRDFVLGPERMRVRRMGRALGLRGSGYLAPELARVSGFAERERHRLGELLRARRSLRAEHYRALTDPILAFYFEVHDKLAAAHGLDHRHPYFDVRLVEFCLALPAAQRLHDGWDRVIQRRAFRGLAPEPIRARLSKSVWTENFERQLFARNGERVASLVLHSRTPLADYCDLGRLRRDYAQLRAGRGDSERVLDLWCAVTLGCWLETLAQRPVGIL